MIGEHSLWWEVGGLVALLGLSAFFSIAETAMMAINRYRLSHLVSEGDAGAIRVSEMLKRTDRLLGGILIGNTLVITVATTISALITVRLFGEGDKLAYFISPIVVGFLIIVFSEITPKVIGATHPERTALLLSLPLKFALWLLIPAGWFVDIFVRPMLRLVGIRTEESEVPKLSPEEIRTLVIESSGFMPKKHRSILLNLFDVGSVTVQDVMVPRARIESIKLDDEMEDIVRQVATAHHSRLPVFRDALGDVVGILQLRKVIVALPTRTLDKEGLKSLLMEPYFVPASTPVLSQLQYFQENHENIALVVDEYGELMGLLTLEDILEEIIGKFTTTLPSAAPALAWDEDGSATAEGAMAVREVNRALGLSLPTDGPKTLNGLIVEHLQDIPEADVAIKIGGVPMEILHAQGRTVKTVRIFRPPEQVENTEVSAA